MQRLGVCFISQRIGALCQCVGPTHKYMHDTKALDWVHDALLPVRRHSCLSSVCSIGKIKPLPSRFAAKPLINKDIYSSSCYMFSSANDNSGSSKGGNVKLSQKQKLKIAVRDYGAVVIIFHVGISLLSLAGFYLAIANGIDVISLLQKMGLSDYVMNNKILLEGSTFVIAYGIHKLFAPARIAVTLSAAPFLVRYLRKIQILKSPKSK